MLCGCCFEIFILGQRQLYTVAFAFVWLGVAAACPLTFPVLCGGRGASQGATGRMAGAARRRYKGVQPEDALPQLSTRTRTSDGRLRARWVRSAHSLSARVSTSRGVERWVWDIYEYKIATRKMHCNTEGGKLQSKGGRPGGGCAGCMGALAR